VAAEHVVEDEHALPSLRVFELRGGGLHKGGLLQGESAKPNAGPSQLRAHIRGS